MWTAALCCPEGAPLEDFAPAPLLRSAHLQTLLGSRGRQPWVNQRAAALLGASRQQIVSTSDGVRLEAWIAAQPHAAPTVILIHGWLGHAGAGYVLSAGALLFERGYSVIRLNLRDHGDTAHLNEELFNSARIKEVLETVDELATRHATGPTGLAGFSLGGNFALRVARELALPTVAVCPALDPCSTMRSIDAGWMGYRLYFVNKWRNALRRKQQAFPHRYEFEEALRLRSVSTLTDLFVARHTPFASTEEYLAAYTLDATNLSATHATVVYAEDDPVIPAVHFEQLPPSIQTRSLKYGGHCAFVRSLSEPSWVDDVLVQHFDEELGS